MGRVGQVARGLWANVVFVAVVAGVVAGLAVAALHHPFAGLVVAGCSVLAGALVRATLSARQVGLLATRSRLTDVVVLAVLGGLLIAVSLSLRTSY